jgi:hypothetical protein
VGIRNEKFVMLLSHVVSRCTTRKGTSSAGGALRDQRDMLHNF